MVQGQVSNQWACGDFQMVRASDPELEVVVVLMNAGLVPSVATLVSSKGIDLYSQ